MKFDSHKPHDHQRPKEHLKNLSYGNLEGLFKANKTQVV